jgi:hypothetical protein
LSADDLPAVFDALHRRGAGPRWSGQSIRSRCVSLAHPGDRSALNLSIFVGDEGALRAKCWSGACESRDIFAAISGAMPSAPTSAARRLARPLPATVSAAVPLPWGVQANLHGLHCALLRRPHKLRQLEAEKAVSRDVAVRHRLGLDERGRIVLMIHDGRGRPISVERLTLPSDRWPGQHTSLLVDKGCPRWLWTPSIQLPSAIVLAESAFDALACESAGYHAAAAPGATIWRADWAAQLHRQGVRRAVVLFDADTAGRTGARKVTRSLRRHGIDAKQGDLDPQRADGYDICDAVLAGKALQ